MSRQKGSALLLALLIMALITGIAVVTGDDLQRALVRNQTLQWQTEAKWALSGNEAIILSQLTGHLPSSNAIHRPGKIDDMIIEYRLRDLNSCFNLNALQRVSHQAGSQPVDASAEVVGAPPKAVEPPPKTAKKTAETTMPQAKEPNSVAVFTQLVKYVTGLDNEAAQRLTHKVVEWANPAPLLASVDGQADGKNRLPPIMDISELRIIPDLELTHYQQLKPWLCVLPDTALKININALEEASAPLLSALTIGELTIDKAKTLIQSRPAQGWDKPEAITAWLTENNQSSAEKIMPLLTLTGNYFLLSQWAMREEQRYELHSLIKYDGKDTHIEQRKYGISGIN
ncbi:type II secretion system minor pseudopilin GspK [Mixta theicola]|nr:type II secretion system minor pseudopilin GspK [Mixta theicola]